MDKGLFYSEERGAPMENTKETKFSTDAMTFYCHTMGSVESTNKIAMEMVEQGAPEGTVIAAKEQTMGKGRVGRIWESPEGGLWMSVVLRPSTDAANIPMLNLLGGIAVARGLISSLSVRCSVRWPNDILVKGKKICGILSELSIYQHQPVTAVIGIGVNGNFPISRLSPDLAGSTTTLQDETGGPVDIEKVKHAILTEIGTLFSYFQREDGPERILREWKETTDTIGHRVKVSWENNIVEGIANGLDPRGNLIVEQDDGTKRVTVAGDCRYLD